ncbi:MAG: hypothetical protein KDA72_18950, partial [Planctomycetales bacterium]|nr:hypothetical protein [Planctomycetales bacterium]
MTGTDGDIARFHVFLFTEGILHLVPPPNVEYQDLEWQIETWLRRFWVPTARKNKVYHQVALSPSQDWVHNYR